MGEDTYLNNLKDLGEFLKSKRTEKGIKIEEIHRITKIRTKYIKAMEKGNFSLIPGGDVYIRGFLKNYAESIGINPKEVLDKYKNITRDVSDDKEVEEEPDKDMVKTAFPKDIAKKNCNCSHNRINSTFLDFNIYTKTSYAIGAKSKNSN